MGKFKHGFPVSSAVTVGFLSKHKKADKQELIQLVTAMLLSEELNQDINRMAQAFNANLELASLFQLPEFVDAPTVWAWRFEGLQIIRKAAEWITEETQLRAQPDMGRRQAATFAFQTTAVINAFKSKLKKEQRLAEEVVKKALTT